MLALVEPATGRIALPGGPIPPADRRDPTGAFQCIARKQGATTHDDPVYLGYLDNAGLEGANPSDVRVRLAAPLTPPNPHRPRLDLARVLATPEQIAQLCAWTGASIRAQLAAVHAAREKLGLPAPVRQPITCLSEEPL